MLYGRTSKGFPEGVCAGLGFSFPLLYTMEIWWHRSPV
ncbi:DUF2391 family protein [Pontibacter toksunensis]|uniref:DUF2391 family protein n=1 Tax=Pontibacter toksunensis TaxID=1332631 RepID=A0ABW6BX96_9BACT